MYDVLQMTNKYYEEITTFNLLFLALLNFFGMLILIFTAMNTNKNI